MSETDSTDEKQRVATVQSGRFRVFSMFESARFKLTVFYLAVILVLSLTLTIATRSLAQYEYERSNVAQRGAFRGVVLDLYGLPRLSDDVFRFQTQQEKEVRAKLDLYLELINLGALVFGGLASYWFAGRTLRPIERAHEAQRRFASDASHELRTPLTVIRAENEVFLRQKSFSEAEAREQIKSNLEEVDRLERLASNLLALTSYEADNLELKRVRIRDIVNDATYQAERLCPGIAIKQDVAGSMIIGHRESLAQLLSIILENACKYGNEKPVDIAGKVVDGKYQLSIRDRGAGISDEDMPHIFERLYRGDKARSQTISGHGLGLALAKQIALANRSNIIASNHPDGGAVFTVVLTRPSR